MNKKYFLVFLVLLLIPIQEAIADNNVLKIIKVTGTLVGGVEDEDFLLPEAVTNQNKTIIFMSVNTLAESNAKEFYRSYDFVNNSAIRFHGSNNVPANNIAMDFLAYLVEFTSTSDLLVQNGTVIVDGADVDMEFVTTLSPSVNASNSFFTFDGLTMDHSDLTIGSEEFGITRVINSTSWGYEPFDAPNSGDTEVRFSVIDWNNSNFIIQNGTGTLVDGVSLNTIVPSPAVNRTHTIILMSYQIEGELDASIRDFTTTATLNPSNEIEIERGDNGGVVNYRWELITFPTTFATVIHDEVVDDFKTLANVKESYQDIFSPAVNFSNSIAIGTGHNPMSLGNSRVNGGGGGAWDKIMHTIELINSTAINATVADGSEKPTLPYQVIEFTQFGVEMQIFNQTVTDTTTNLDDTRFITNKTEADSTSGSDQIEFETNKTAIDFTVTVDAGQGFNITKAFSDIVVNLDQVNLQRIFNQIVTDISTSLDQVQFEIDKIAVDTTTNLEETGFNITKAVVDIVVNLDTVNINVIFNQIVTDISTSLDQVGFEINKTAIDFTITVDAGQNMNITKSFTDIVVNIDQVNLQVIIEQIITDITTSLDEVRLTITKNVIDFVTNAETVEAGLTLFQNASDTTTNSDQVNLIVQLKPVIPSGGGAPSSGGVDPVGLPLSPVRLIGLNIASEVLVVERGDIETSEFAISWFGDDFEGIKLTSIEAKDDFVGFNQWFAFSPTPDQLDVAHEIGFDNRLPTDPRSQFNTALDDYVLNVPRNDCTGTLVSVVTANCFNPIVYEVPLTFEFELKGATFIVDHIVQIDARDRPKCVILDTELPMQSCDVVDFTLEFWWLLALIALVLIAIPKFIIPAGKRKVRVAHFVRGRNDDLLGDDPTSKRLKRLKKVR